MSVCMQFYGTYINKYVYIFAYDFDPILGKKLKQKN